MAPHLLAPPKYGGVSVFSFGSSSSYVINGGAGSVSEYKGAEDKEEEASFPLADAFPFFVSAAMTPAVIASAGAATTASGFYFGAAPSSSVMLLHNKGAEAKDLASATAFSFF